MLCFFFPPAFAYRVPIGDYNYLQCTEGQSVWRNLKLFSHGFWLCPPTIKVEYLVKSFVFKMSINRGANWLSIKLVENELQWLTFLIPNQTFNILLFLYMENTPLIV